MRTRQRRRCTWRTITGRQCRRESLVWVKGRGVCAFHYGDACEAAR